MVESPLTTVVVVSHNYGRFVHEAVRSAVEQTTRPRVLVVDDASTDDTRDTLALLESQYPAIICRLLPSPIGLARVRNHAAEIATTEWVVYLDADDWLDLSYVTNAEAWLRANPGVDVLTTDMTIVRDGVSRRVIRSKLPRFWNDLLVRNTIVQTSFIRRSLVARIGGYDPSLEFEDWDFWIRVLQAGGRIARLPGSHVFWRDHGHNKSKRCDERLATTAVRRKHQQPLTAR